MKSLQYANRSLSGGNIFVYMLLCLFPLAIWVDGYSNITATKMISYLVILAGFVVMMVMDFLEKPDRMKGMVAAEWTKKSVWWRLPDVFVALFLLAGLVAWFTSPYFSTVNGNGQNAVLFGYSRYDGWLYWASYALIYFLSSRYARLTKNHLVTFGVVYFAICLLAIIQLFGINVFGLYPASSYPGWHNWFFATLGNADIMAGFMCMATPLIGIGYIVFRWNKLISAFFLIVHTLAVYVMLWLEVDMAIIGLLVVIGFMAPLLVRNKHYLKKALNVAISLSVGWMLTDTIVFEFDPGTQIGTGFGKVFYLGLCLAMVFAGLRLLVAGCKLEWLSYKWLPWSIVGLEVLAVIGLFCYFRFAMEKPTANGLMKDLYELCRFTLSDTAGHNRVGTWRCALAMGKENFWTGTGTGTFPLAFKSFAAEYGYTRYANRNLDFAHNEYIHLFCTTGIFGIASYLGFLISCAWSGLKNCLRNPRVLFLGAAVLGYAVQVFFCFSIVIIAPLFWLFLGLLVGESRDTLTCEQIEEMTPFAE